MNRDDFTIGTKRTLANRVAWRCSRPNCRVATVGPGVDPAKEVILGEAAHLTAASPGGPRFDSTLTPEQRRSPENGIWLCRPHARLVDLEHTHYSLDLLRAWKSAAEAAARSHIDGAAAPADDSRLTLVQLGDYCIFEARWVADAGAQWGLEHVRTLIGGPTGLETYCAGFDQRPLSGRYVILERYGDGRAVLAQPTWESYGGVTRMTVPVGPRALRTDPHAVGTDIAISEGRDLVLENGDFATVSGIANAKQRVRTTLSTRIGELALHPDFGSRFIEYATAHEEQRELLAGLLGLEIARLASFRSSPNDPAPLRFVERVVSASIGQRVPGSDGLPVDIEIEWGNHEVTSDRYLLFVSCES